MLDKAASEFSKKQLAPERELHDKYPFGPFYHDVIEKAFELDFFHVTLPEELNGMGQGMSALSVVLYNICQEDSSLGGVIFTNAAAQQILLEAGENERLKELTQSRSVRGYLMAFPAFNDPSEISHCATVRMERASCRLSGMVEYVVLGGLARYALIPGKMEGEPGYSFYLVKTGEPSVKISEPVLSLGLHACPSVDMTLNHTPAVRIGKSGNGGHYFLKMADRFHVAAAAMSAGIIQGAFKEAFSYCKGRFQGGHAIINWSEVKMMLANVAIQVENAEMILESACRSVDDNEPKLGVRARSAALHVQELACEAATDGIQLLGGVGYMKDFGQEKRYRDAKQVQALLGLAPLKRIHCLERMIYTANGY